MPYPPTFNDSSFSIRLLIKFLLPPFSRPLFLKTINDKNDQGLLTIWWCTRRLGKTADEKNEGNYPHEVFKNPRACVQQQGKVPSKSNILIFSVYSKDTNKFSSNSILITVACVFAKLDTLFQPNYPLNRNSNRAVDTE